MSTTLQRSSERLRPRLLPGWQLEPAREAWAAVAARVPRVPVAVSWPWTVTWLAHYGDVTSPFWVVVDDERGPCAVALVTRTTIRRGPFAIRCLHLGTAGEPPGESVCVEHNALLCDPARAPEAAGTLAELLAGMPDWDELRIDGTGDDQLARAVAAAIPRSRLEVDRRPLAVHDLRAGRERPVVDALRAGPRRRVRASLRRFAEIGPLAVDAPADGVAASAVLSELADLHQRRWTAAGAAGAYASPRFRGFHHALAEQLVPQGRAVVLRVRAGARTVGCLSLLIDGDRALFVQSGLERFDDHRLRPGLVAHVVAMEHLRERGCGCYDFLAGEHRYKRELATGEETLSWSTVQRPRVRLRLLRFARAVRDRWRRSRGA